MDQKLVRRALYIAAVSLFIILVIVPVVFTFFSSFIDEGQLTLQHYVHAFSPEKLHLLLRSCLTSILVAAIATFLGALVGWVLTKTNVWTSGMLKLAFLIPLVISPYYFAFAWKDFFSLIGIFTLQDNYWMVVLIHVLCFFPLAMLITSHALNHLNKNIEEAGLLVASGPRVTLKLILPLIKHALFSSFILIFILSVSEFAVATYFLVPTYASDIFLEFAAFYNHEEAIASSFLLVTICLSLLAFEASYLLKAPFISIGSKGSSSRKIKLNSYQVPISLSLYLLLAVTILLPVVVLGYQAFDAPPEFAHVRNELVAIEGGGEKGYYIKQGLSLLSDSLTESLGYALIGASLLSVLGFLFAYFDQRKTGTIIEYASLFTFAIPATVFGIALVKFYNRPLLDFAYSSLLIIQISYMGRFTFISLKVIGHALRKIPSSLEEAAILTGASSMQRIRKILIPLSLSGIFAAFIISFIFCLGEVASVIIVYPPGSSLLPIKIATSAHNTPPELISSMVFISLITTLGALAVLFGVYKLVLRKIAWKQV